MVRGEDPRLSGRRYGFPGVVLALLVVASCLLAAVALSTGAPAAGAAEVRSAHMRVAYPVDGAWHTVNIHMLLYVDGSEPFEDVVATARGQMLARFDGGVELQSEVSGQFALIGVSWPDNRAEWRYNPDGKPEQLSDSLAILSDAAETWNNADGSFEFEAMGLTEASPGMCDGEPDGKNTVGWGTIGTAILALTCFAETDVATEADILFDWRRPWTMTETNVDVDFQSVALHEFGHVLGLDHSDEAAAVMHGSYTAGTLKRELHPDDIDGLLAIYGQANGTPPVATVVVPGLQRD